MRTLSSLNLRGRSLIAAGVATALSAVVIGEDDLLRLAVVLIALPVLVAAYVAFLRVQIEAHHQLSTKRAPVGTDVDVDIDVRATSRVAPGTLLCEDRVDPGLGASPRVTFRATGTSADVRLRYTCTPERRGLHRVGPLRVTVSDAFGLCERTASSTDAVDLIALPVTEPVPQLLLNAGTATGGVSHTRTLSGRGEDDFSIREHTPGDGLRKVHWRTSARMGKLMIRREEQLQESRAAVLLDDRASAHRGSDQASTFERAVALTASVGAALVGGGYRVRLFAANGEVVPRTEGWSGPLLLDHLALTAPTARTDLGRGITALRATREDGLLVAVLGDLTVGDAEALCADRSGRHTSIALLTDVVAAAPDGAGEHGSRALRQRRAEVAGVLREHGWWVVELGADQSLADGLRAAGGAGVDPAALDAERTAVGLEAEVA